MYSMKDRVVLITGASAGIGEGCAHVFAAAGARLLLAARRGDKLKALAAKLSAEYHVDCHTLTLDVQKRAAVMTALDKLPPPWAEVDVLINNAGLVRGLDKLHEAKLDDWEEMIDTNVKGLLYVSRAIIPGMVSRGRGHIINIGSIAGRDVYPGGNVYCATKHAVRALTSAMRMDLVGTPLRVTTVDPGMVETEFSEVRFRGDKERARKVYEGLKPLVAEDVAEAVLFAATRPLHVDVSEIVIMPTAQASVWLSHRGK